MKSLDIFKMLVLLESQIVDIKGFIKKNAGFISDEMINNIKKLRKEQINGIKLILKNFRKGI